MNSIKDITPHQLRRAADIQERILTLRYELETLLGHETQNGMQAAVTKRKVNAQGLANIRAGARKRWAKARGENGRMPNRPKSKMSAAGRARIAARMKARWAAAKRAG